MSERVFLDTNILVYAIETQGPEPEKASVAQSLTRRNDIVISTQVLGEFYQATTSHKRESPLTHFEACLWIQLWKRYAIRSITVSHIDLALEFTKRFKIHYFDALILAAAKLAHCSFVFSEDLNANQDYGGISVKNPFTPDSMGH